MTGFWTEEREQMLTELVATGLSAGRIADALGCSRNAVISKIHRGNGCFGALARKWKGGAQAAENSAEAVKERVAKPSPPVTRIEAPAVRPVVIAAAIPAKASPAGSMPFLYAVDADRCLWFACEALDPDGPDMPVCGAARADMPGTRYCEHHRLRQYNRGAA